MNHNSTARLTKIEPALNNHGMTIGRDPGVTARTGIAIQSYNRILQRAASKVIILVEQSYCFSLNNLSLFLDLFFQ